MVMDQLDSKLTAYFLPYVTPSHSVPLVQMAQLFASRGVHVTILSTPLNSLLFNDAVSQILEAGHQIEVQIIPFPSKEVGLPEGIESLTATADRDTATKITRAFMMLQKPMEDIVRAARPDCVAADMHCYWATDLAAELAIPCLLFHVRSFVCLSAIDAIYRYLPHEGVKSDSEPFLLPGLPDPIEMCRSELPVWFDFPSNPFAVFKKKIHEADEKSFGTLGFSFYELEKKYADHYRTNLGRRAWPIGPLQLHCDAALGPLKKNPNEMTTTHPCIAWLDTMPAGKVLYVCFGSLSRFSPTQLFEIAAALESAGHPFVWVVRKKEESDKADDNPDWLPEGFRARIADNNLGMLIEGWAPQVMILNHPGIGGFMTHCGGNAINESASAGIPMITWPLSSDHFYNQKLVTQVAKIGVDVGNKKWGTMIDATEEVVEREKIEKAVRELMGDGEEAEERRRRVKELSEAAKKAVLPGGSSFENLTDLIHEIRNYNNSKVSADVAI